MSAINTPRRLQLDPAQFPVGQAMRDYQVQALETAMRQAETALAFLQARLEADRKFGHALTAAQSAAEAMDLWRTYWHETLDDYSSQSTTLASDIAQVPEALTRLAHARLSAVHSATSSDGE